MTLEEAVKGDLSKSLEELAKYFYSLGYGRAKSETVHCKDCKHYKGKNSANECGMARWYKKWLTEFEYCSRAERKEE